MQVSDDMDDDQAPLCEGTCIGGPLDGRRIGVRYPKGFLAIHRPRCQLWIYDNRDGDFYARSEEPVLLDDKRRMRAMEEFDFDVLALDPEDVA